MAFSFWGAALAAFDTDNSFFYVAAVTFLIQVRGTLSYQKISTKSYRVSSFNLSTPI